MQKFLKSKTVWGGILLAVGHVMPLLDAGIFGPKAAAISQGVGIILGAVGVKHAIEKKAA